MDTKHQIFRPGLEGVIAAETRLSEVDGARGALLLAGHPVEALSGVVPFEDAVALFLDGDLPHPTRRAALRARLGEARVRVFSRISEHAVALGRADGMDALRELVAALSSTDDPERSMVELVAAVGVGAASWAAARAGRPRVAASASRSHSEDLLAMSRGEPEVSAEEARALDAYLVAVVDHGLNASTFTARVVASTESDDVSAVVAAIGALKGRLHGGAPGPVLDMLDAIGVPEAAPSFIRDELAAGRRIMGMGHRVYRVRDPRAAVLERALRALEGTHADAIELARATERAATELLSARHPERPLRANVEFYTAVLLNALGVPRAAFTPLFACARVVGWVAHVHEQRATGRIIRPASRYVGPRVAPPSDDAAPLDGSGRMDVGRLGLT